MKICITLQGNDHLTFHQTYCQSKNWESLPLYSTRCPTVNLLIILFFHLLLPPTHILTSSTTQDQVIIHSSRLNFGNRGPTNLMKNEVYRTTVGEVQ
jgi:hypothetical protein